MLILGKKRRLALASQALAASLLIAFGAANPLPARAQGGLPTLGDGSDLTSSEERRLGDRIIRELYRDPDYIDDPVIGEYVQGIWQPLMAAARARGELSPELDERFAWEVLLGRDRTVNAFALPGGYLGLHSIALTRPVWLAFEGDRLRIVKAVEVHGQYLPQAQPGLTALPWTGPRLIAVRALDKSDPAFLESVQRAMQGDFASFYPQRWIAYEQRSEEVRQLLYPLAALENRPGMAALRELIENKTGLSPAQQDAQLGYLPLVQGATLDWVAVLNKTTALPVAYGHVDGW